MARFQPKLSTRGDGTVLVERFSVVRRAEHLFVLFCITALLLTGLPQKLYDSPWAISLLQLFGGLDATRRFHHGIGLLLAAELLLHVGAILGGVALRRSRLSLFPVPDDVIDLIQTWRYRFGFSNTPPRFGVFNYRQKFQYVGLLLSGGIVILAGLALLYPLATVTFLPGHIIPAARAVHSSDGLTAFLLLIVWHVYGTLISPDAFPLNRSILTGTMTKDELRKYHLRHYEEIFGKAAEGK